MLRVRKTISVTPKRDTPVFGESKWLPITPVDVWYRLDEPQVVLTENGKTYLQTGRLYARRGVDLKDTDKVPLPEGDFGIVSDAQLNQDHPMNAHDFGWVRFHIRKGG